MKYYIRKDARAGQIVTFSTVFQELFLIWSVSKAKIETVEPWDTSK